MPTFYESDPIEKLTVTINSKDFQNAYLLAEQNISPIHHREVKAGFCLTIAALIGSSIPFYANHYASYWIPIGAIAVLLAIAVFFFLEQPRIIKKWAAQVFESNQLFRLKNEIVFYRDCVTSQNEYEKMIEYWTDFDRCLENSGYYVLTNGTNRSMLVIKKQDLSEDQLATISVHLENTFAYRYHKARH
jgi:hypothetical protein